MALFALLLCTGYIFFLLVVDRRVSRQSSLALWIPTIWLLIAASRPLATWATSTEVVAHGVYTDGSGSTLDRTTLTVLAAAGIVVLSRRRFDWSKVIRRNVWLWVLLGYMFVSTFWSEITLIAMKRWTREIIAVIMALIVTSEADPRLALGTLFRRTAYVLVPLSLLLIRFYPVYGRRYGRYSGVEMWTGVTGQKNELGRLCMISAFFLLLELYRRWRSRTLKTDRRLLIADLSVISLSVYLLIGSHSATSLATLLVGTAGFLALRWLQRRGGKISHTVLFAGVLILMGFGVATPFLGGTNLSMFTSSLNRDPTLTGRTVIWASLMPAQSERPLFGYGMGSFWTAARRNLYDIPTAHNGYLDILLDYGEVGLMLWVIWVLSCARQLNRTSATDQDWAAFSICLLCMALSYNMTESALNSLAEFMTAVIVITVLAVPYSALSQDSRVRRGRVPVGALVPAAKSDRLLDITTTMTP